MYISLFGKKENNTKIYFKQSNNVVIGSDSIIENAFQVGNYYNILQKATNDADIKVYKYNLILALIKLQAFEIVNVRLYTQLIECLNINNYKNTSTKFCDLLVKLYPKYYTK